MSERYAVYCRTCGHVEDRAWQPATNETHSKRTEEPLTPQGHVPIYCQKCGNRNWEKPASKAHLEEYDRKRAQEARAIELTSHEDFEGMFKIPEELRASAEVRRALANLLGPLEGEALKAAQKNILTVARAGVQYDALGWIDRYDRAVQKAVQGTKGTAKAV